MTKLCSTWKYNSILNCYLDTAFNSLSEQGARCQSSDWQPVTKGHWLTDWSQHQTTCEEHCSMKNSLPTAYCTSARNSQGVTGRTSGSALLLSLKFSHVNRFLLKQYISFFFAESHYTQLSKRTTRNDQSQHTQILPHLGSLWEFTQVCFPDLSLNRWDNQTFRIEGTQFLREYDINQYPHLKKFNFKNRKIMWMYQRRRRRR